MFADDTTIPLPAMYIDSTDPAITYTDGRVKAGRLWLDISTGTIGTLKKRNAGNTGWDTLINLDATVSSSVIDARIKLLQKWTVNFTDNGDAYIPAYEAMTIDIGTAAIGTGTLAYEKSTTAAPGTFSSTSLPATLQAGAWLKVSVSGISGFKAVELKRTA